MSLALAWHYEKTDREALVLDWPMLKKWSLRIDNWAHSDTLCGIYARILESDPDLVEPALRRWNASKNPWLRRISIVSLFFYSSQRKTHPKFATVVELLEPQLDFEHYYVQKGVGWTLRELGNAYPEKTQRYLEKNIHRISAHAFSAAVEKIPDSIKKNLKELRSKKKLRTKRKIPR